jgi:Family of unknown function (DUF5995)
MNAPLAGSSLAVHDIAGDLESIAEIAGQSTELAAILMWPRELLAPAGDVRDRLATDAQVDRPADAEGHGVDGRLGPGATEVLIVFSVLMGIRPSVRNCWPKGGVMGAGTARHGRVAVRRLGLVWLLGLVFVLGLPGVGRATLPPVDLSSDPWFIGWSSALPPAYMGVNTASSDICVAGSIKCVTRTALRLERQVASLGCDHNAVFSLAYARTTEAVGATEVAQPSFFSDNPWLNHYDATFADFYFSAWNSWQKSGVAPPAWATAFRAADTKAASGAGNLLLGMNAHINNDLPFTLYAIGLVAPDGSSRKPDHDKVNQILNKLIAPLVRELAARYDPQMTVPIPGLGGSVAYFLLYQALPTWRERAWRNAVALASAPDAAARALIATEIQQAANTEAQSLLTLTKYSPPLTTSAVRDAYCAAHLR